MAKKRKAATRRATQRPARRRRRSNPDTTINTLVILVVIVMVLGGLYFYAQNKKQSALWPTLTRVIATITAPSPTASPPGIGAPGVTGSIPAPPPPAGAKSPAAVIDTSTQPTSALEAPQAATVAAVRMDDN